MAKKLPGNKDNMKSLFPNLMEVLEAYGQTLVERYREGLVDGDHIATKNLYNSVKTEVKVNKTSYVVEFIMPIYGEYLEQGTKPHFPPIDDITKWIRAKKIVPRRDDQGRLPTEKQLSYLIARKISEEGTPARRIFEKANALTYKEWDKLINEAISMDLQNNLDDILKNITH